MVQEMEIINFDNKEAKTKLYNILTSITNSTHIIEIFKNNKVFIGGSFPLHVLCSLYNNNVFQYTDIDIYCENVAALLRDLDNYNSWNKIFKNTHTINYVIRNTIFQIIMCKGNKYVILTYDSTIIQFGFDFSEDTFVCTNLFLECLKNNIFYIMNDTYKCRKEKWMSRIKYCFKNSKMILKNFNKYYILPSRYYKRVSDTYYYSGSQALIDNLNTLCYYNSYNIVFPRLMHCSICHKYLCKSDIPMCIKCCYHLLDNYPINDLKIKINIADTDITRLNRNCKINNINIVYNDSEMIHEDIYILINKNNSVIRNHKFLIYNSKTKIYYIYFAISDIVFSTEFMSLLNIKNICLLNILSINYNTIQYIIRKVLDDFFKDTVL
ncbi:hypothetical protein [Alphaentomopoxvirus acuprea]|uniref:Uncharacterized protein n=1 Tax=Alphaentomopoxvirus acuprea TaxID=62099 RepID=W6JIW1_9POXV|nr:hypothetical protein BA82_gp173 [Anomala cuprea entomopoxvirus]BAO49533.1 hypothetical protein [Anomala cuprea entomopoxvirus]